MDPNSSNQYNYPSNPYNYSNQSYPLQYYQSVQQPAPIPSGTLQQQQQQMHPSNLNINHLSSIKNQQNIHQQQSNSIHISSQQQHTNQLSSSNQYINSNTASQQPTQSQQQYYQFQQPYQTSNYPSQSLHSHIPTHLSSSSVGMSMYSSQNPANIYSSPSNPLSQPSSLPHPSQQPHMKYDRYGQDYSTLSGSQKQPKIQYATSHQKTNSGVYRGAQVHAPIPAAPLIQQQQEIKQYSQQQQLALDPSQNRAHTKQKQNYPKQAQQNMQQTQAMSGYIERATVAQLSKPAIHPIMQLSEKQQEVSESMEEKSEAEAMELKYQETMEELDKLNKETYDNKQMIYEKKMEAFNDDIDRIQNGTDLEYLEKIKKLTIERDDFIECAELFRQHQIGIAQLLYNAEIEQYLEEYKVERDGLKARIQSSLEERKKKLMQDRDAFEVPGDDKAQTATRTKLARVINVKTVEEKRERKRKVNNVLFGLKDHEIYEDMDVFRKVKLQMLLS